MPSCTRCSIIDPTGSVNATDRLYLAQELPTLITWGRRIRSSPSNTPTSPIAYWAAAL